MRERVIIWEVKLYWLEDVQKIFFRVNRANFHFDKNCSHQQKHQEVFHWAKKEIYEGVKTYVWNVPV